MSFAMMELALDCEGLSSSEQLVLVHLARYADGKTGECFPSQGLIAKRSNLSEKTVWRAMQQLEELGLISRERRSGTDGYRSSDRFWLHLNRHHDEKDLKKTANPTRHHDEQENAAYSSPCPTLPVTMTTQNRSENLSDRETKKARARGSCFVPESWSPDQVSFNTGMSAGLSPEAIAHELAKFRDHEFRAPRSDWNKAFRNWLRKAAEGTTRHAFDSSRNPQPGRADAPDPRRSNTVARRSAWADLAAEQTMPRPAAGEGGGDGVGGYLPSGAGVA